MATGPASLSRAFKDGIWHGGAGHTEPTGRQSSWVFLILPVRLKNLHEICMCPAPPLSAAAFVAGLALTASRD